MATATDYASPPAFSRSSSLSANRSPDTASAIYPERAIRPLPRSRLKSKLSPEQASSIIYPPQPSPVSPTLNFIPEVYNEARPMTNGDGHSHAHPQVRHREGGSGHNHCTCGGEGDSGDEDAEFDHPDMRYDAQISMTDGISPTPAKGKVLDVVQRRLAEAARAVKPAPPASTASSADGYESFENTSNKKKRKIPLGPASGLLQSQLSAEMASMSMDGAGDDGHDVSMAMNVHQPHSYSPSPASTGTGISGAGRGRYGRPHVRHNDGVRRPLGSSSANSVNGYGARMPARNVSVDSGIENTGGIISQAIKSAAEQGPLTPQKGQENTSLLQSATSNTPGSTSQKTQFTFTMASDSASKMVDQQTAAAAAYASPTPPTRAVNGQPPTGGYRAPNTRSATAPAHPNAQLPPQHADPNTAPQQPAPKPPKPRRRPSKEFTLAAKQRALQQRYTNYHHRPTKDSLWICEFCEYEAIFGTPPLALIRQYEIKDRQDRKRQAEKRRLLEKAKAKGRKGKKGSKKGGGGGGNNNVHSSTMTQGGRDVYDPNLPPPQPGEDEFYDDAYDDDDRYDPMGEGGRLEGEGEGDAQFDEAYYRHQQQHAEALQMQQQQQHGQLAMPPIPGSVTGVGGGGGGGGGKRAQ